MPHTTLAVLDAFLIACSPLSRLLDNNNDSSGSDVVQCLCNPVVASKNRDFAGSDYRCNVISFDHNGNTFTLNHRLQNPTVSRLSLYLRGY
mgnify:CR=1 FL=1